MHSLFCNLAFGELLEIGFWITRPWTICPRQLAPDLQTSGPKYENTYVMLDIYIYIFMLMK